MRMLHLGGGQKKASGSICVDLNPRSQADVLCDLDQFPYPFANSVFDSILCEHVLEHLENPIRVMEELHRVCKPGARIYIYVPYFSSIFFYRDPTHKHFFSAHTFDYFVKGTPVYEFHYSDAEFKLLKVEFPPPEKAGRLKKAFFSFLNRHIDFYEKRLAFILPRHLIAYELEVVKPTEE